MMIDSAYKLPATKVGELERMVVEDDFYALNTFDISHSEIIRVEVDANGFASLTEARQYFIATYDAEGYVNSGGLTDMFQYMSDAQLAAAIGGYRVFDAKALLTVVEKATKKLPKRALADHAFREDLLYKWLENDKDPFKKLDDKFIEIGSALRERSAFVLAHRDEFFQ